MKSIGRTILMAGLARAEATGRILKKEVAHHKEKLDNATEAEKCNMHSLGEIRKAIEVLKDD